MFLRIIHFWPPRRPEYLSRRFIATVSSWQYPIGTILTDCEFSWSISISISQKQEQESRVSANQGQLLTTIVDHWLFSRTSQINLYTIVSVSKCSIGNISTDCMFLTIPHDFRCPKMSPTSARFREPKSIFCSLLPDDSSSIVVCEFIRSFLRRMCSFVSRVTKVSDGPPCPRVLSLPA